MFEVPEAKRVRRADLDNWDDTGSEIEDENYDEELQARLNAQIARSLGITESYAQPGVDEVRPSLSAKEQPGAGKKIAEKSSNGAEDGAAQEKEDESVGEEEFVFRLFSTTQPTQKIVLEEDTGPTGDGTFTTTRPLSYYVANNLTEAQKQQYIVAAVTGEDIMERSKDRAWGFEMPWKVTRISVTRKKKQGELTTCIEGGEAAGKKRRPGKKQRISLRKRAKAKEDRKEAEAQKALEKEEHIKEKKKRLNRLKKLRKRAKSKDAKLAANGSQGGDEGHESGSSE